MQPKLPAATWGPQLAVAGLLISLGAGILLGVPVFVVERPPEGGDLSAGANAAVQLGTAIGFVLGPLLIASAWGKVAWGEALRRLGLVRFRLGALKWMAAAVGAYLVFAAIYAGILGAPEQEDIADSFGPLWVQVLLIVIAASLSEEICFRGMFFGGLRTGLPVWAAALISAAVFGLLHALTGLEAVPVLVFFGFVLCLLYEKTDSIVPGIILHMLNNSVALIGQ